MIISMNPYILTNGNGQKAVAFYEKVLHAHVISFQTYGEKPEEPGSHIPEETKDLLVPC